MSITFYYCTAKALLKMNDAGKKSSRFEQA
jgi:hypothetical protein